MDQTSKLELITCLGHLIGLFFLLFLASVKFTLPNQWLYSWQYLVQFTLGLEWFEWFSSRHCIRVFYEEVSMLVLMLGWKHFRYKSPKMDLCYFSSFA